MQPHSLVFDLDGTLWDTSATCAGAWNRALMRLGIHYREISERDVRRVTGLPHMECVQRVFVGLNQAEHERICEEAHNLRAVIERNGLRRPFFIGDTEGDLDAARAVGVPFVHARYGFGEVSDADYTADGFDAIAELVG